jgi:hypothetical protein
MARPVLLIGAFALALAAIYSFNLVVYKRLSLMPNGQPPLLLARMLADGESKAYLRAVCPQRSYALCPYLNQLPETSDEIVWHFLPKLTASKPELWNIVRSEQRSIIIGTVLTFPAWTARSVISNILRQLVTFDSAAWFYKDSRRWLLDQFPFAGTGYLGSLQDRGFLSVRAMGSVNRFHTAVIVISLLAAVHFGIRCVSAVEFRPVVLALVVALGLVANAFVCTLSGVYGRFEGRGIWLIPFCAVMLGLGAVAFERRSKR